MLELLLLLLLLLLRVYYVATRQILTHRVYFQIACPRRKHWRRSVGRDANQVSPRLPRISSRATTRPRDFVSRPSFLDIEWTAAKETGISVCDYATIDVVLLAREIPSSFLSIILTLSSNYCSIFARSRERIEDYYYYYENNKDRSEVKL